MQYNECNILSRVYSEPSYLTVFKQIINGQSSLVVSSVLTHQCTIRCNKKVQAAGNSNSGCCKYKIWNFLQNNPQDPDSDTRVVRDEMQERRGAHVHAPVVASLHIISASHEMEMERNPNDC